MTLMMPNQLREEDNKALGVGYLVQEDQLSDGLHQLQQLVCGAVFATRLKGYILKHGQLNVEKWYHFDSQTVLGAIQRELRIPGYQVRSASLI